VSDFWTTERIQQLLGESDKWPQLTVEDGGAELYLDGEQSRFSLIDEKGFAYGWIPGEKLARLCAAAPAALAWCVDAIETAYSLANSYATTNEAQRKRIDELLARLTEANQLVVIERAMRKELESGCVELANQISSEDDLWVVMPNMNEMVKLRHYRKKLPPPTHEHAWEFHGDGSVSEGITFRYRVCTVCGEREELGDAQ